MREPGGGRWPLAVKLTRPTGKVRVKAIGTAQPVDFSDLVFRPTIAVEMGLEKSVPIEVNPILHFLRDARAGTKGPGVRAVSRGLDWGTAEAIIDVCD